MSQVGINFLIFIKLRLLEIWNRICRILEKKIVNDEAPQFPQFGENIIEIPQQLIGDKNNINNEMYGNISENIVSDNILDSFFFLYSNQ